MKNNKFTLLLTLTVLLCNPFCSYGASPTPSSATIEKRLEKIEGILKSNAFAYDINLRAKVAEAISQQKMLLRELDSIENRLLALESKSTPAPTVDGISKDELDKELARLKKEYDTLFKTATDFNEKALGNLKKINDSNDSNSKKAIDTANNFVIWVLTFFTIVVSLTGLAGSIIVKVLSKKIDATDKAAKQVEELAEDAERKSNKNLAEMISIKHEIKVLQDYIDYKHNFHRLYISGFKPQDSCKRMVEESSEILEKLKSLPESEENEANKSYVAAAAGVICFMIKRFGEAYKFFEIAKDHNVHERPDRKLNFASSAAKLYVLSEKAERSYFKDVMGVVLEWRSEPDLLEQLKEDDEIKVIWDEVLEELKNHPL